MPVAVSSSPGAARAGTGTGTLDKLRELVPAFPAACDSVAKGTSNFLLARTSLPLPLQLLHRRGCYHSADVEVTHPLPAASIWGMLSTLREQISGYISLYFLWSVWYFWALGPDCVLKRPQAKFCFQLQCSCSEGVALTFTALLWISNVVREGRIWIVAFFPCHPQKKQVNRFASQCIR